MKIGIFTSSILFSVIGFCFSWWWGGTKALSLVLLLTVLEITLSFDNAVVNAGVLKRMSVLWQKRFLTWGIPLAVFGTRLILPLLIVSAGALISPIIVITLALTDSASYGKLVLNAHHAISAFGGSFLLLVALKYFFNEAKTVHWIHVVEHRLARWGKIEAIEIVLVLCLLVVISLFVDGGERATVLVSGIIGVILHVLIEGITSGFSADASDIKKVGLSLFVYLNILDSAFSLDGVVGAFALTSDLLLIVIGLGIGAMFVRSLTIYLVRERALDSLLYLEHGAHWAIFGLAVAMFGNLVVHVPEFITGCVGVLFISLAYRSSRLKT